MKFTFAGYGISIYKLAVAEAPKPIPKRVKKPRKQKCMYREKVCYKREEAVEAMSHIKNPQIRIYCCEFCHMWHLTHKKNDTRRH